MKKPDDIFAYSIIYDYGDSHTVFASLEDAFKSFLNDLGKNFYKEEIKKEEAFVAKAHGKESQYDVYYSKPLFKKVDVSEGEKLKIFDSVDKTYREDCQWFKKQNGPITGSSLILSEGERDNVVKRLIHEASYQKIDISEVDFNTLEGFEFINVE